MGDHRLIIGDATAAGTVERLLAGAKPHLMVTDPPYGIEYDPDWRTHAKNADGKLLSTGSGRATGKVANDDKSDWRAAWALFPGDVIYCWHAGLRASSVQSSLEACGFSLRAQIIWAKSHFVVGRGDYHVQHEPCWYAVRDGKPGRYVGGRKQATVWSIDKPQKSETGHGTQKPIECMRRPILNNSKRGDAVYEPFAGSGTTLIACEMEGRRAYCVDIDPTYAEVIIRRWQQFTGKGATREDGATLEDLIDGKISRKRLRALKSGTDKLVPVKRKAA
jgi:DNA modification methylase